MNENVNIVHEIFSNGAPVVFFLALVICITWIVVTVVKSMRHKANLQSRGALYRQMIDRFGTAPEFFSFLQSDSGQRFIEENVSVAGSPMSKVLVAVQIGVVTALVGIGLIVFGWIFESRFGGDLDLILSMAGTICTLIGIGFLISAMIAYKLSVRWGLIEVKEKPQSDQAAG